jgi:ectoine hydroxylase-related dioxygenase (phytanoyl-CoA dioxygenase family)
MSVLAARFSARSADWHLDALASVRRDGYAIVEDVMSPALLDLARDAMYGAQDQIRAEIGRERLERAGELGVLRLMLRHDSLFFSLLELDEVLAVVDGTLPSTAILHLQNGLILPPRGAADPGEIFQNSFHRDFPRHMEGYVASLNTFLAIDEFTTLNGATLLVPGSHQRAQAPDRAEMQCRHMHARRACTPCTSGSPRR